DESENRSVCDSQSASHSKKKRMPLKKKTGLVLVGPVVMATLAVALFYALEQHAAYHSPLYGAQPDRTPRMRALNDIRERAAAKAEEERRRAELLKSLTTEKMVQLGNEIVHGKGLCLNCHSIGETGGGVRGPNLQGVGGRAANRVKDITEVEYLAQSLYQPEAFIVPGFAPGMAPVSQPPTALDDLEIVMVIAYLQSLGGTPTVTPDTKLPYTSGSSGAAQ
ncbi:c-type cytochrome, partial [Acidobacteria bacterium AH-259-D05]|nr:c-type cytochrome [Acidobacteria bacterium AH-259-D05]